MEAPANIIEMCIHARNVLSLAKNTLGSTLMGAFRCFTMLGALTWSAFFFEKSLLKKLGSLSFSLAGATTCAHQREKSALATIPTS